MSESDADVVLVHGGWADGSSWSKVIAGLRSERVKAVAATHADHVPMVTAPSAVVDIVLEAVRENRYG